VHVNRSWFHELATKSLGDGESYDDDRDGISYSDYQESLQNKVERCFDSICYSSSAVVFSDRHEMAGNSIILTGDSSHGGSRSNASLSIFAPANPRSTYDYKSCFRKRSSLRDFDRSLDKNSSSSSSRIGIHVRSEFL